ncbi:DUF2029 domain-containing protein [Natronosalvus rutilus]|uniref:DUF2029 domain-containing protein n=1 Tax=Natronosalvus rutilus TaxID=2953753 RepID=A0A9E7NC52_9EURY|nr:DUF2029 domain-containing protein [Natronosalvus rutilus]UTF54183.1 DUF2029 domain-containing protein [Natronosalvus rutilus]
MLQYIEPFTDIIFPVVYILFFVGTIAALALANRRFVRKAWLACFFALLLAVTVVGMTVMPVVEMHKFSQPNSEEMTYYEIRIVDSAGNELELDDRATPPMTGSRTSSVGQNMAYQYDDEERMEMGRFYIENVNRYRETVESGGPPIYTALEPPRYVDDQQWTAEQLENYEEFESISIYERTIVVNEDSDAVERNEETHLVTIDVANETVTENETALEDESA